MLTALYIHIPFCNQICTYCDFHKELATDQKKTRYINALLKELEYYKDDLQQLKTVYIGGGTPSSIEDGLLKSLLWKIKDIVNLESVEEYTIECNPNDISKSKALLFKEYGINRVSMGVQTFHNHHLKFLNREHSKTDIYHGIKLLKDAKIDNINIDMIFSLPNQTIDEVKEDIAQALALDVPHISYYSLIFEEKTKLYYLYLKDLVKMQSEDTEAAMYNLVIDGIKGKTFNHYEISNFAKEGFESKHNTVYWKNKEYLGIGSGSHSLYQGKRFYNERNVKQYIEHLENGELPERKDEVLEPLREEMIMGLRLMKGVHIKEVEAKYNITLKKEYPELDEYIEKGILVEEGEYLHFSREGLLLGNLVFSIF